MSGSGWKVKEVALEAVMGDEDLCVIWKVELERERRKVSISGALLGVMKLKG